MSQWKAKMPRTPPANGKVQFVMAIKQANGFRTEIHGEADQDAMFQAYLNVIEAQAFVFKPKVNAP